MTMWGHSFLSFLRGYKNIDFISVFAVVDWVFLSFIFFHPLYIPDRGTLTTYYYENSTVYKIFFKLLI